MPIRQFHLRVKGQAIAASVQAPDVAFAIQEVLSPPAFTTAPSISGTAAVGSVLTLNRGTVTNGTITGAELLRGATVINTNPGATYTPVEADIGANLFLRSTATGAGGTATATSAAAGPVAVVETSITLNTIDFTLAEGRPVGTYWNDEPYIVRGSGSVAISETSPASGVISGTFVNGTSFSETLHGMMWNPAQGTTGWATIPQGWNSFQPGDTPQSSTTINPWNPALNIDPGVAGPFTATEPGMLVKTRNRVTGVPNDGRTGLTTDMAAVAIVNTAPPANAFRPPLRGHDMTSYFTTADVDISFLPNVPAVSGAPTYATLLSHVDKVYQTALTNTLFTRGFNPLNHQEGYGRDIAAQIEEVMVSVCTDALTTEQKRTLMNCMVQIGLDILGAVQDGASWAVAGGSYGGGQHWAKPVAIVTAYALRNAANSAKAAELLDLVNPGTSPTWAPEDRVFRLVNRQQIETFPLQRAGQQHIPYWDYMENSPMWNSKPTATNFTGSAWAQVYRTNVAGSSLIAALALRMMGLGGTAYMPAVFYEYLDMINDWRFIETWTGDNPSAWKISMLNTYIATYSAQYSNTAAPTLVRTVARGVYVWFEFDRLISRRFVPASSAFTVLVNGSPATVVSAANQFTTEPFTNRSPDCYGRALAVRLSAAVPEGATVTIAYAQPGTNQARTLAGTFVPSISATTATNLTGALPDPVTTITRVNGQTNLARSLRQASKTNAPASAAIGWMQLSARFRIKSITLNDTLISNQSGGTTSFWLYWVSATNMRLFYGSAATDRVDINNASTNLPLNTDITLHMWFDYSASTLSAGVRIRFVWNGGSWEPTIPATARTPSTPNISTNVFSGGIHIGGPSNTANREADMDHIAYLFRWGSGTAPAAPNFADSQFAWNADWGGNGQNVWGTPTRYYAGTVAEWNGGIINRGNGASDVLAPFKFGADGEELLTEYVAGA